MRRYLFCSGIDPAGRGNSPVELGERAMSEAADLVRSFLESWKPYAQLPPGNAARRTINRFIETDEPAERARIIARTNLLFQLHEQYERLGIRREDADAKSEQFAKLLAMPAREMAAAIESEGRRDLLELLQAGFEFGRNELEPRFEAVRRFMLEIWAMPIAGLGIKYSIYGNGVFVASGGLTHDEMARKFSAQGLGGGRPIGGGKLQRRENLGFDFDTSSTAFGGQLKPEFVTESFSRWLRLTGGQVDKVTLTHKARLSV